MPLNNTLEVISKASFEEIHQASIKILNETGIRFHCPEALAMFKQNGARVDGETVYITGKMVEDALATCPETFTWTALNPEHTVTVGKGFLVQPNVGPVFIQDMDNGRRKAVLEDYANIMKLGQAAKHIHINGTIPVDPSDVDPASKHLHMMYEILKNTDKPIIGFCFDKKKVCQTFDMLEMAFGGTQFFETNHCMGVLVNPLTPLGYAAETIETIMEYAKRNQIILLAPCIMAGISGPISLLGTAVLQNVELLAGIVLAQMTRPGTPVVFAAASTTGDMKTGSFAAGTPEAMLINAPTIQMGNDYYHLPTRTMCGITHSKAVDCQAGYETMMSLLMGVLSGANMGVQCVGTLDALMTVSYEKIIIDQEMISRVLRIQEGIQVSAEALAVEAIQAVGAGGTFLMHPSTVKGCRSLWTPSISDWNSCEAWQAAGSEDLVVRANRKYKQILETAPPTLLDPDLDTSLKAYVHQQGK